MVLGLQIQYRSMLSRKLHTLNLPKSTGYFALLAGLWVGLFGTPKSFASNVNFGHTVSSQSFTVPTNVTNITVTLTGADGGTGGNDASGIGGAGGPGGRVTGTLAVTPGQTLTIYVGGAGGNGSSRLSGSGSGNPGPSGGGYGGGAGGNAGGGAGGGAGGCADLPACQSCQAL